ncbi:MAG: heterodisulfide reductase-related iron-sulfur binding cluster, partial [Gemmatimonadetes bacterium]|nr:heterodisulfide reductase-related iron-sulfur binding cluster [Gemmatimonadota bacterium]
SKLGSRAGKVGFDWPDVPGVLAKVQEEVTELHEAVRELPPSAGSADRAHVTEELGDLLFSIAQAARHLGVDAEAALREANAKFERRFRDMEEKLAAQGRTVRDATPAWTPRTTPTRARVATLDGCVMEGLFTEVNRATERVLCENGYDLCRTPGQQCCGALHVHAGDAATARRLAKANIVAFEAVDAEVIAVNSAGCGAMMKDYGHLLADDPEWSHRAAALSARVRDASELLADAGPRVGAPLARRITYDAPCHLEHAQRITTPPLQLLAAIPLLEHVPLTDREQCCGSAGIFNLIEPDVSQRVLGAKLEQIAATGAPVVATGNPGCLMHIGAGLLLAGSSTTARHPIELLDESYARRER